MDPMVAAAKQLSMQSKTKKFMSGSSAHGSAMIPKKRPRDDHIPSADARDLEPVITTSATELFREGSLDYMKPSVKPIKRQHARKTSGGQSSLRKKLKKQKDDEPKIEGEVPAPASKDTDAAKAVKPKVTEADPKVTEADEAVAAPPPAPAPAPKDDTANPLNDDDGDDDDPIWEGYMQADAPSKDGDDDDDDDTDSNDEVQAPVGNKTVSAEVSEAPPNVDGSALEGMQSAPVVADAD